MNAYSKTCVNLFRFLKIVSVFTMFVFISSCAIFKSDSNYKNISCGTEELNIIQPIISKTVEDYLTCLKSNEKNVEFDWFNEKLKSKNNPYNIRCEIKNSKFTVLADGKESKNFPGFNFNSKSIRNSSQSTLEDEIFHEISHLYDHGHFKGFDLAEISDNCCRNKKLNDSQRGQACRLLKNPGKNWTSKEYLKEYATMVRNSGRVSMAYKTLIGANIELRKQKDRELLFSTTQDVLQVLDKVFIKNKISRADKRKLLADPNFYYHFILNMYSGLSSDEKILTKSAKRMQTLRNSVLNNPVDRAKILLYGDTAELMSALLEQNPQRFKLIWTRFRDRAVINCRHFDEIQLEAMNNILAQLNPLIFEYKNDIQAGDFYEIATYFSNPCRYALSIKTTE